MKDENKKRIIKVITTIVILIIIVVAVALIIYGLIPQDATSGGHICEGDGCKVPI